MLCCGRAVVKSQAQCTFCSTWVLRGARGEIGIAYIRIWCARLAGVSTLPSVEFANSGEDFGEAIREPIEATARMAIRKGTAEHFHHVLSGEHGINDAI